MVPRALDVLWRVKIYSGASYWCAAAELLSTFSTAEKVQWCKERKQPGFATRDANCSLWKVRDFLGCWILLHLFQRSRARREATQCAQGGVLVRAFLRGCCAQCMWVRELAWLLVSSCSHLGVMVICFLDHLAALNLITVSRWVFRSWNGWVNQSAVSYTRHLLVIGVSSQEQFLDGRFNASQRCLRWGMPSEASVSCELMFFSPIL